MFACLLALAAAKPGALLYSAPAAIAPAAIAPAIAPFSAPIAYSPLTYAASAPYKTVSYGYNYPYAYNYGYNYRAPYAAYPYIAA